MRDLGPSWASQISGVSLASRAAKLSVLVTEERKPTRQSGAGHNVEPPVGPLPRDTQSGGWAKGGQRLQTFSITACLQGTPGPSPASGSSCSRLSPRCPRTRFIP